MRLRTFLRGGAIAVTALALAAFFTAAQEPFDDLFFFDEDALFGGGDLLTEIEEPAEGAFEDVFLVSDRIEVGGDYRLAFDAAGVWKDADFEGADYTFGARLSGSLFADARPRRDFRVFAKGKGSAALSDGGPEGPAFRLHELFADFSLGERAFVRAGKQTVNWGVGYFFSPADIINIGRIDPEDPEAEREGPIALRLNVPRGRNNLYAYALFGSAAGQRVAIAPKAEFVLGRSEVGLGLYYRADRAPRAMATLSTSLGRVSLFGEAVLSKGSDKRLIKEAPVGPDSPFGVVAVHDQETLFPHVTVGAHYSYSDPDRRYSLSGAGQYYFNGEGYDGAFLRENGLGVGWLLHEGKLSPADLASTGRHYGALSVSLTGRVMGDFSPSLFWLGNLSDGTGMVSLSLGYSGWKHVRPSISISRWYGEAGGEYAFGLDNRLAVSVSVGQSF